MTARRSVGRAAAVTALLLVGLVVLAGPASAIETAEFGMEPASREESGGPLRIEVPAGGGETERALRIWNKTKRPLEIRLQVVSATRAADGTAALGGDSPSVQWVTLAPASAAIPPRGERKVTVRITMPKDTGPGTHTFAIVAEPAPPAGQAPPAVVSRLAVAGFLDIGSAPAPASSLALLPVLAAAVALAGAASLVIRQRLVGP